MSLIDKVIVVAIFVATMAADDDFWCKEGKRRESTSY